MHNAFLLKAKDLKQVKILQEKLAKEQNVQIFTFQYDNLKIDDARFLREKLYQSTGSRSLFFLFFATALTPAQNALLKVLEELPEQNTVYILTPNPQALLPTVRSRLVFEKFDFEDGADKEGFEKYLSINTSARLDYLNKIHQKGLREELAFLAFLEREFSKRLRNGQLDANSVKRLILYKKAISENIQPVKALRESLAFVEL